jgi:ERF superfamily
MPDIPGTALEDDASIHVRMIRCLQDIRPVPKAGTNEQQGGYKFRRIEDAMAAVHEVMARHGVGLLPITEERRSEDPRGKQYVTKQLIRYRFFGPKGDHLDVVMEGEGLDVADKGTSKAQTFALKYALIQTFMIPVEDLDDPDASTPSTAGRQQQRPQQQRTRPQSSAAGSRTATPDKGGASTGPAAEHPSDVPGAVEKAKPDMPAAGEDRSGASAPVKMSVQYQWTELGKLAGRLKWDKAEMHRQAGVESLKDLTWKDALELMKLWNGMAEAQGGQA